MDEHPVTSEQVSNLTWRIVLRHSPILKQELEGGLTYTQVAGALAMWRSSYDLAEKRKEKSDAR